jgi:hypothetical protein
VHIRLTDKGQKLAKQLNFEPFAIFRHALEQALEPQELMQLLALLDKLAKWVRSEVDAQAEAERPRKRASNDED